jgi:hypothetical protein
MKNIKKFNEFINEYFIIGDDNEYHGELERWKFLNLEKTENGLWIYLNKNGKKENEEEDNLNYDKFWDYFEDIDGNSDWLYFDDLGKAGFGLTSAPGFTVGYYYDDNGELTNRDNGNTDSDIYYYDNYMITDFTDKLKEYGKVFFQKINKYV